MALGPLGREHIPLFARWLDDFAVARTFDTPRPRTIEALTATYEAQAGDAYPFTLHERASWRPIGCTILYGVDWYGVDWREHTADFSIIIGEADCRGQGYGTEVTRLLLDYAFTALGLYSVMLTTRAFSLAGQAAYRKTWFKEFGRRRQCSFLACRLHDLVYMDCLGSEFTSPVPSKVFVPDEPRT